MRRSLSFSLSSSRVAEANLHPLPLEASSSETTTSNSSKLPFGTITTPLLGLPPHLLRLPSYPPSRREPSLFLPLSNRRRFSFQDERRLLLLAQRRQKVRGLRERERRDRSWRLRGCEFHFPRRSCLVFRNVADRFSFRPVDWVVLPCSLKSGMYRLFSLLSSLLLSLLTLFLSVSVLRVQNPRRTNLPRHSNGPYRPSTSVGTKGLEREALGWWRGGRS